MLTFNKRTADTHIIAAFRNLFNVAIPIFNNQQVAQQQNSRTTRALNKATIQLVAKRAIISATTISSQTTTLLLLIHICASLLLFATGKKGILFVNDPIYQTVIVVEEVEEDSRTKEEDPIGAHYLLLPGHPSFGRISGSSIFNTLITCC